jgi:hypothetical protein
MGTSRSQKVFGKTWDRGNKDNLKIFIVWLNGNMFLIFPNFFRIFPCPPHFEPYINIVVKYLTHQRFSSLIQPAVELRGITGGYGSVHKYG